MPPQTCSHSLLGVALNMVLAFCLRTEPETCKLKPGTAKPLQCPQLNPMYDPKLGLIQKPGGRTRSVAKALEARPRGWVQGPAALQKRLTSASFHLAGVGLYFWVSGIDLNRKKQPTKESLWAAIGHIGAAVGLLWVRLLGSGDLSKLFRES